MNATAEPRRHRWDAPHDHFERTCTRPGCGAVVRKYDGEGGYQYWPKGLEYRDKHGQSWVQWLQTIPGCEAPVLTAAQERVYNLIPRYLEQRLTSGHGVSIYTAAALVASGLCQWHIEPYVASHRRPRGTRTTYTKEWSIQRTDRTDTEKAS